MFGKNVGKSLAAAGDTHNIVLISIYVKFDSVFASVAAKIKHK